MTRKQILKELADYGVKIENNSLENDELEAILKSVRFCDKSIDTTECGICEDCDSFNDCSDDAEMLDKKFISPHKEPKKDMEDYYKRYPEECREFVNPYKGMVIKGDDECAVMLSKVVKDLELPEIEIEGEDDNEMDSDANIVLDEDLKTYKAKNRKEYKRGNFLTKQGEKAIVHDVLYKIKDNFDLAELVAEGQCFPNANILTYGDMKNTLVIYSGDEKEAYLLATELIKDFFGEETY